MGRLKKSKFRIATMSIHLSRKIIIILSKNEERTIIWGGNTLNQQESG